MSLDTTDIEAIVEHLGDKVQFYNARGVADNARARNEIRTALESYVGTLSSKSAERFDLVKIAFKKVLGLTATQKDTIRWDEVGRITVKAADAVLAEMEKTPDTGPSAEEIAQQARTLAGEVSSRMEKPNLAIVREIRARIQIDLDAELNANANNPTTNVRVSGYRDGGNDKAKGILAMIDAAMEKAGAVENDDAQ